MNATSFAISKPNVSPRRRKWLWVTGSIAVFLTVCYFSAAPVIQMLWGIHEPRAEHAQGIINAAEKYGLNPASVVCVEPGSHRVLLAQFQRSIPEALIFNRQGRAIAYKSSGTDCNAGLFSFIPSLQANKAYKLKDSISLQQMVSCLRDLNGNPISAGFIDTTADFRVFISWAAFTGKLNKDHVKAWQELAAKNASARIQVILVNFDVQQWWPAKDRQRILSSFSF